MVQMKIRPLTLSPIDLIINPFQVLGIKKNSSKGETKNNFRKKMKEAGGNYLLRAQICLAYDIIVNKEYYKDYSDGCFRVDKKKKILLHIIILLLETPLI